MNIENIKFDDDYDNDFDDDSNEDSDEVSELNIRITLH